MISQLKLKELALFVCRSTRDALQHIFESNDLRYMTDASLINFYDMVLKILCYSFDWQDS